MDRLTVSKRAWIGVVLLTALLVVAITQAKSHFSGAAQPVHAAQE
jgi:hypothetical protein